MLPPASGSFPRRAIEALLVPILVARGIVTRDTAEPVRPRAPARRSGAVRSRDPVVTGYNAASRLRAGSTKDASRVERMASLWYEDFEVGAERTTEARQVTDADIRAFAELSGDYNPLHLDDEYATAGPFGRRIAHGLLGLVLASGLMNASGLTTHTLVAFLGLDWAFRHPVFPGDPLHVRMRVAQTRPTGDPGRGLVKLDVTVLNGAGDVVQEGTFTILVRRRPG